MRHRIGTERAAQSLSSILREREMWNGKRDTKRERNQ
jgi:hypothetical protein